MRPWRETARNSWLPGLLGGTAATATVAMRCRRDGGSGWAPINATSHVLYGPRAAHASGATWAQTVPGLIINLGAGLWWALVFETLFGRQIERRGATGAVLGGATTGALAYLLDYRLLPRRLSPGWELSVSRRSVGMGLAALGAGLAVGAMLRKRA